ncbi:MAG: type II toxin-antitoxin system HicB family antitoxin [ANME-2 cluster archaeon]|nr:type II toxin-antitoxin system HicB family antitoxin [ANME-2 cluster archaeon]
MQRITAYVEKDIESVLYIAIVPGIPGAHTQAETLDELQNNLKEVLELCLEEMEPDEKQHLPEFVGIQQVEVTC